MNKKVTVSVKYKQKVTVSVKYKQKGHSFIKV